MFAQPLCSPSLHSPCVDLQLLIQPDPTQCVPHAVYFDALPVSEPTSSSSTPEPPLIASPTIFLSSCPPPPPPPPRRVPQSALQTVISLGNPFGLALVSVCRSMSITGTFSLAGILNGSAKCLENSRHGEECWRKVSGHQTHYVYGMTRACVFVSWVHR